MCDGEQSNLIGIFRMNESPSFHAEIGADNVDTRWLVLLVD